MKKVKMKTKGLLHMGGHVMWMYTNIFLSTMWINPNIYLSPAKLAPQ